MMKTSAKRQDEEQAPVPGIMDLEGAGVFRTKESQVAEFLRERIISGNLVRGQKLKQAELAKLLNLSITPVREALKLLEAEGYVTGSSHRGAVVAPLHLESVGELYALRYELETRLCREAVKRIKPEDIATAVRINREMLSALNKFDLAAVRSANFRFHFHFYELADQPQTLHFVRILWAKYPFDLLAVMPNRQGDVIKEHQAFLDALAAGDAKGAIKAMQAHFESGQRGFRRHHGTAAA